MRILYFFLILIIISIKAFAADIRSAGVKGDWNSPSTWIGGVVPGAGDNVTIVNGDTVYYNVTSSTVANIFIGENAKIPTMLFFKNDANYSLTVTGSIVVSGDSASLVCQAHPTVGRNHTLTIKENLISTGMIDFKTGTSPNNAFVTLVLDGNKNSILKANPFIIFPSVINEFYAITINKTGGARVILQSDIGMANVSTAILTLSNGIVETGEYSLNVYSTASGSIVGGSQTSYVYGNLGRGWPSSGGASNKIYPIGDAYKYRPAYLSNTNSSYHLAIVGLINGNANTGSSSFSGNIDKVSSGRYYRVKVGQIPRSGNVPSPFYLTAIGIGYYEDDGVSAGNTNLRMAVSYDQRNTWIDRGPTNHTTVTGPLPTQIMSETFSQSIPLDSVFYIALARVTGTTENTLDPIADVKINDNFPEVFELKQNYPNPFNSTTNIKFSVNKKSMVSIKIYNVIGELISEIVKQELLPGNYSIEWNAANYNSGTYFYRIESPYYSETKKMILIK